MRVAYGSVLKPDSCKRLRAEDLLNSLMPIFSNSVADTRVCECNANIEEVQGLYRRLSRGYFLFVYSVDIG
jgi:hypothetical protein